MRVKISTRFVFCSIIALLVLCGTFRATLSLSGICWEQKRQLSDEEIVRIAVDFVNDRGVDGGILTNEQAKVYTPSSRIPYSSVEEFLELNPNCCRVRRGNAPILHKLFDGYLQEVTLQFAAQYRATDKSVKALVANETIGVSNCGRAFRHYFD